METPVDSESPSPPDPQPEVIDDPDADIILRSCDLQEFRVPKIYLIKCSPVLSGLIQSSAIISTVPSPDSSTSLHDGPGAFPYIQLSETGLMLSSLLSFILPLSPKLPPTTEQIIELLSVTQKYKMVSILAHIRGAIASQDSPFIHPETTFQIYTLAQRYGLRHEVVRAARKALTFPMTIEVLGDKLDNMPSAFLHLLWKYYQSVRISLRSDLHAFRTQAARSTVVGQICETRNNGSGISAWLDGYIACIGENPALFSLTEFHMCLSRHLLAAQCTPCGSMTTASINAFWKELTIVIENSMASVSLTNQ